jgi:ComF family protein
MPFAMPIVSRALALVAPPFCWSCGDDARRSEPLCSRCRAELSWLGEAPLVIAGDLEAWAPLAYEGPARALVRALKFRGAAGLAAPLAAQIVAGAPTDLLSAGAELVPVPLHPARARRRGFNQAELLAAAIGSRTGMRVRDCLRRRGPRAAQQVGRGRADRLAGVGGAIELLAGVGAPSHAVLVDDVVTTGATLAACATALRAAGAVRLAAVAYARTPGR